MTDTRHRPPALDFGEPVLVRGNGVSFTRSPDNGLLSVLMDDAELRIPSPGGGRRATKEIEFVCDVTLRGEGGRPKVFADLRAFASRSGPAAGAIEVQLGRSRKVFPFAVRRAPLQGHRTWRVQSRVPAGARGAPRTLRVVLRLSGSLREAGGELLLQVQSLDLGSHG